MSLVGNFAANDDRTAQNTLRNENNRRRDSRHSDISANDDGSNGDEIQTLARTMSRRSDLNRDPTSRNLGGTGATHEDVLNPASNSPFDPFGGKFDPAMWSKAVFALHVETSDAPFRSSGISFQDLSVHGFGSGAEYQGTVGNGPLKWWGGLKGLVSHQKSKIQILQNVDGLIETGEMLVVLGPPGSGCSTFLKTLSGERNGIFLSDDTKINYKGVTPDQMRKNFNGECIYSAETEAHFPSLTVGQTLEFAASARCPRNVPGGYNQLTWSRQLAGVVMAVFGISDTIDVKVGNDYVRGVSGGQRKRVSIAEVALSNAPLSFWDNSTRGLDSATAISFCQSIKNAIKLTNSAACVAIYQAPQPAYDVFDKVIVFYGGRQIYFGPTSAAKEFFVKMGFHCPTQQTTPDFLTGLTSDAERTQRKDFEGLVPSTPIEFEKAWKASTAYKALRKDIADYDKRYPANDKMLADFKASRRSVQSKHVRAGSPFTLSYMGQIKICLRRGIQRFKADPSLTVSQLGGNTLLALIVSSVFYNLPQDTSTFYLRGVVIFFSILLNAFGSALEILTLYAQRPIVDKQARYAFYHPSAEAMASMLCDMPYKIVNAISFNLIIYFMTNLRREAGRFFFFTLISFMLTLTMSMFFRSIASLSRSLSQALVPAALLILALVMYTGFAIPTAFMLGWSSWLRYLNPIYFGFEALMVNEFHDRIFACAASVPTGQGYPDASTLNAVCSVAGSVAGQNYVQGTTYVSQSYGYVNSHKWRNFGIIIAFMIGLMGLYLGASEFISEAKSKGEVKIYPRTKVDQVKGFTDDDAEATIGGTNRGVGVRGEAKKGVVIEKQTAIFHFEDLCYDVPVKGGDRRLLDHVDGWVKPGTLTALMGVSGAGKTTLLDVLASRVTMGVIGGNIFVDGNSRDDSFQRKTGYVQQQDLHLDTATVREALQFSAILRQPSHVPRTDKLAYVEEILKLLEMDHYADAVVGKIGEGLNVEERKRLSIGVEMVAKPELLLFLDEPSSGLDSQTSWSILNLLEKLKDNGQAVLCTIHQPSAMLFSRFDRLLFLARGGRTIYYGDVGDESKVLTSYFERNGSQKFPNGVNPAEFMLEVIGAAPGSHSDIDWHSTWKSSPEFKEVKSELKRLESEPKPVRNDDKVAFKEFAAPFMTQMIEVTKRVAQQYWRSPTYVYSKIALCVLVPLFIGFSFFKASNSQQGLQNQLFSVFLLFTIFGQLVQQIMPQFVKQRESYEVRERPSRTYSWVVFMLSNIFIELPWNSLMAVIMYCCLYYPIGLYQNAAETETVHLRGFLFFLLLWSFLLFTSTFSHFIISFNETAETGGNLANVMFSLCLIFCGVLATPQTFPKFWIFMYYLSPFRYLAEGLLGTAVGSAAVQCATSELLSFAPTNGQTCAAYMAPYLASTGTGYLIDGASTTMCQFCSLSTTNAFLSSFDYVFEDRWRDFGIMWIYIIFNIFAALGCYWLARVPKKAKKSKSKSKAKQEVAKEKPGENHCP